MPATPETLRPEVPQVTEHQEEFIIPETLQQKTGVQVVQKNFKTQIKGNNGQPLIQTPPAQVITVSPPADDTTLAGWAKGSTLSSLTWLAAFWIRIIKKAMLFGWKVVSDGGQKG